MKDNKEKTQIRVPKTYKTDEEAYRIFSKNAKKEGTTASSKIHNFILSENKKARRQDEKKNNGKFGKIYT